MKREAYRSFIDWAREKFAQNPLYQKRKEGRTLGFKRA